MDAKTAKEISLLNAPTLLNDILKQIEIAAEEGKFKIDASFNETTRQHLELRGFKVEYRGRWVDDFYIVSWL